MSDDETNSNGDTEKVSHKFVIVFKVLSHEIPQSIVVSDFDSKHKIKSKLYNLKWWLSTLLAIVACLQIAGRVCTTGNSTAEKHKPQVQFPDLYEASVLELQQGLDAGHFSSVDLVKVGYNLIHQRPSSSECGECGLNVVLIGIFRPD
jgi:hypothetical protein